MRCYTMPGEVLAFVRALLPRQVNGSVRSDAYRVSLEEFANVVFFVISQSADLVWIYGQHMYEYSSNDCCKLKFVFNNSD